MDIDFESVPTFEFTTVQIKAVNAFYKLVLEVLKYLPLSKVASKITTVLIMYTVFQNWLLRRQKSFENVVVLMTLLFAKKSRAILNIIFCHYLYKY